MEALWEVCKTLVEYIVEYWTSGGKESLLNAALILFGVLPTALGQVMGSLIASLGTKLSEIVTKVNTKAAEMIIAAAEFFGGIITGFNTKVAEVIISISNAVSSWVQAVKSTVSDWISAGESLISGLWTGFKNKLSSVKNSITSAASEITSAAKEKFGINSPSKVFAEIGAGLVEGLEKGWNDNYSDVEKAINKDMKYGATLDVETSLNSTVTASATSRVLSDADISKLAEAISFNFTNVTEVDGTEIKKESYKYTVQQINNETLASVVAAGGYY